MGLTCCLLGLFVAAYPHTSWWLLCWLRGEGNPCCANAPEGVTELDLQPTTQQMTGLPLQQGRSRMNIF